ncbi:hypothetical protein [Daejeonella lutea]|uniref:Uncharacterized protein n=1 Tax=Daejeonella lutea TaxID=572036 RepID=A0A1T4ZZS2_9SPHI|nr:hypothetical protein [Daejeonella lutea]SKB28176.1 hypothetical protein SAMN05661099_0140 [Daejeonella lutea]
MKWLSFCILSILSLQSSFSQNIQGKWVGKVTQQPGGYSQLYDLELDLSQRKNIWGESYAFEGDSVQIRIGLSGYIEKDSIRLNESLDWIREDKVPYSWIACVKQFVLSYRKEGKLEYLEGTWTGVGKNESESPCAPGRVILSRTIEGLNKFLEEHKDSVVVTEQIVTASITPPVLDFTPKFLNTEPKKITEIVVTNPDLQIQIVDYMKVDNDTVTVYLNRNLLAKNIRIAKRPALINFKLDSRLELHELLLYAENLGQVPPNTSEMILVDGEKRHRVMIVSDKEKTAAVYLRYKPKKKS